MIIEGEQQDELDSKGTQPGEDGEAEELEVAEGGKKPDSRRYVKRERLTAVAKQVDNLTTEVQRLREENARLDERTRQQEPAKPVKYTKVQLREAVAVGQLTQDQADDLWDSQREVEITEKVVSTVKEVTTVNQVQQRLGEQFRRYKAAAPDLMVEGSETRTAVTAQYAELVANGSPGNHATELAAMVAVLGPIEKLEGKNKGRTVHQHHEEMDGGGKPNGGGDKKSLLAQAPERYRLYYEDQITKGMLTREQAEKHIARVGLPKLQERAKRYGS